MKVHRTTAFRTIRIVLLTVCMILITVPTLKSQIQSDSSDTYWKIVAPKAIAKDIYIGDEIPGSSKDSVIQQFIMNIGTWKCRVDSIFIRGIDASSFELVSGFPVYTLDTAKSEKAEFRFSPSRIGLHTAEIVILTQSDTLIQSIRGNGVSQGIEIITDMIDFGIVTLGDKKDTLQTATIRNIGNIPITVSRTDHLSPNVVDFITITGGGAFTLQPNETRKMDLRFAPTDKGRTSGRLAFYHDGPGSPTIVKLFGTGYLKAPEITALDAQFPPLLCQSSDSMMIPVKNTGGEALVISSADIIGLNSSDFSVINAVPITIQPNATDSIVVRFNPLQNGIRQAQLRLESNADPDSIVSLELKGEKQVIALQVQSEVDLGILCPNSHEEFEIFIKNVGTAPSKIQFIVDADLQSTYIFPSVQMHGDSVEYYLRFMGIQQMGPFTRNINVIDSCGTVYTIRVKGIIDVPNIATNDVNMQALVGGTVQSNVQVQNLSQSSVTINSINGISPPFSLISPALPIMLAPLESKQLTISYAPTNQNQETQILTMEVYPCMTSKTFTVQGNAINARAEIEAPYLSGYSGDEIMIPITINSVQNIFQSGMISFSFQLHYNPTLLAPKGYSTTIINDTLARLSVNNVSIPNSAKEPLLTIPFTVGLGNRTDCPLILKNVTHSGGNANITTQDGRFSLLGICREGGTRLLAVNRVSQLLKLAPNPGDGIVHIDVHTVEHGITQLNIYNASGILVEERILPDTIGLHQVILDTESYATGVYMVQLTTPTVMKQERFIIHR